MGVSEGIMEGPIGVVSRLERGEDFNGRVGSTPTPSALEDWRNGYRIALERRPPSRV